MITKQDIENRIKQLYEKRAKDVVMRFSRGNVNLVLGNYITEDELDKAFGRAPWRKERDT